MRGHPEMSDVVKIDHHRLRERQEAMAKAEHARRLEIFPRPCPTCFADVGEPCMTRNGGRTAQHQSRRR